MFTCLTKSPLVKYSLLIIGFGLAFNALAHRYFFSITELIYNDKTKSLEIIHQLTAHDVDNSIAEQQQIRFSTEHPNYDAIVQQYVEANFQLSYQDKAIKLNWVGLEINKGNIFIYQEAPFQHSLQGLKVRDNLLIDNFSNQVNTVNYRGKQHSGSLTFDQKVPKREIKAK